MNIDINAIKDRLSRTLSPHRYQHSLATAVEAQSLAGRWGVDEAKAYLAAKNYSPEEMLALASLHNIAADEWELAHPDILHGPVAAAMLQEAWGIDDMEIAEAIRLHTIPQGEMSDLAKIIYLADKIEPNRKPWPGIDELRSLAYQNLDQAMEAMLRSNIEFLAKRSDQIHPSTQEIWQIYRNKIKD